MRTAGLFLPRVHARPGEVVVDHRARQDDEYRAECHEAHQAGDRHGQRPAPADQSVPPRSTTAPPDLHGHGSLGGGPEAIKVGGPAPAVGAVGRCCITGL